MDRKKLSTGFAGVTTKSLDVFTDDFSPPGSGESFKGGDFQKSNLPFGSKHADTSSKDSTSALAVGNPKVQEKMDTMDEIENRYQSRIKPPKDQFPGARLDKKGDTNEPSKDEAKMGASDNGAFDKHQVDPAQLKREVKKDLGVMDYEWFKKVSDGNGIKYAGEKQYKVIYKNQGRGIYDTSDKALDVLKKYMNQNI